MTVASIARLLRISSTHLAHLFATQIGVRMAQYIAAQRIQLARKLLATTDWQIKRIARVSGHRNIGSFSRFFRAHTGQTPSEYRLGLPAHAASRDAADQPQR